LLTYKRRKHDTAIKANKGNWSIMLNEWTIHSTKSTPPCSPLVDVASGTEVYEL
jgi:hypothetical protein